MNRDHLVQLIELLNRPVPLQGAGEAAVMVNLVNAIRADISAIDEKEKQRQDAMTRHVVIAQYLAEQEAKPGNPEE